METLNAAAAREMLLCAADAIIRQEIAGSPNWIARSVMVTMESEWHAV